MSTRCQIGVYNKKEDKFEDFQALIYRHADGYPSEVLPEIEKFLKDWKERRGIEDAEYCGARLLQYLCNNKDLFTGTLGYGICNNFHEDIEYFYKIYPDAIEVYKCEFDSKPESWKLIETIVL